jgi:hypothetical protein
MAALLGAALAALLFPASAPRTPRVRTSLGRLETAAVLRDAHYAVWGRFPSPRRLATALAHVRLEGSERTYCRNLGMIGAVAE